MKAYRDIVRAVLDHGEHRENRTGVPTKAITGWMFEHDMAKGFPLLTTRRISLKLVKTELEFFIKGKTDKRWLQERGNHIWDEWANPKKAPYGHDVHSKRYMLLERDLGPVYGFQWRHLGAKYESWDTDYKGKGVDQLKRVVETLKTNPNDRRMLVTAWNPLDLDQQALPPCHYGFQVTVTNGKLNLLWNQRSVDVVLGLPFNIASYALLLHLLAKETGFQEGKLIGFLGDVHIYENHLQGAKAMLEREPFPTLPELVTTNFTSIFNWTHEDTKVMGYQCHPVMEFEIAI